MIQLRYVNPSTDRWQPLTSDAAVQDGEVQDFRLVPVQEVARLVSSTQQYKVLLLPTAELLSPSLKITTKLRIALLSLSHASSPCDQG